MKEALKTVSRVNMSFTSTSNMTRFIQTDIITRAFKQNNRKPVQLRKQDTHDLLLTALSLSLNLYRNRPFNQRYKAFPSPPSFKS